MSTYNFRFLQAQPFALYGAGAITGATTITLKSMTDIDGNALTMAGTFGTIAFGTLDPGNGNLEEAISFTGLVNNANGTVTLTGVSNTAFEYPYTQTSGLAKTHAGSTPFIITNTAAFYDKFIAKDDDGTVTEVVTFTVPNFPQMSDSTTLPTLQAQLVTKQYVDNAVTGGATFNAQVIAGVAGETLVSGSIVYLKSADQRWWKADPATAATSVGVQIGISQTAGAAGAAVNILTSGLAANVTGLTAGVSYYVATAGTLSSTAGTFGRFVGVAVSTTSIIVNPTDGFSIGQQGTEIYADDTGAADAYVVSLVPAITALQKGLRLSFKATNTNTTTSTLNLNGLGIKSIFKNTGSVALIAGDIASGQIVTVEYDGTNWQLQSPVGNTPASPKFGGTGADGALVISSGVTTVDLASAAVVVKNYTSISITGSGSLAFSNPNSAGTVIILKSQGNVTITSSSGSAINLTGLGGVGATGNNGNGSAGTNSGLYIDGLTTHTGQGSTGNTAGVAGVAVTLRNMYPITSNNLINTKFTTLVSGSGGGSGTGGGGAILGGSGGRGAGSLYIQCGGSYNFTTGTINGVGTVGGNASVTAGNGAGGGGGGGGAMILVLYNTLTADSGTYATTGGAGGTGNTSSNANAAAAGGGGATLVAGGAGGVGGSVGNAGTTDTGTGGAAGSAGGSFGGGGGGGAGGLVLRAVNTDFA